MQTYIFMLDADIWIEKQDVCEILVASLENNDQAVVSGGVSVKDVSSNKK